MHEQSGETNGADDAGASTSGSIHQIHRVVTVSLRDSYHRCDDFTCARSDRVTRFLKEDRHKLAGPQYANIFVLQDPADNTHVLGYYCLAAGQINREWTTNKTRKDMLRPLMPMVLLGFMGRDDGAEKGIGELLLADAARRAANSDIAVWGMMLHAETEGLVKWYAGRGFKLTPDGVAGDANKRLMYAPLKSLLF